MYRACSVGARRGKGCWSITRHENSFPAGPRPIGTCQCPGSHWIVRIWTAVLRSSCGCFSLAKKVLVGLIDNRSLPIHLVRHLLTTGHSS